MHDPHLAPSLAWAGPMAPSSNGARPAGAQKIEAPGPWVLLPPIQMVTVWIPLGVQGLLICTLSDLAIQTRPQV